MHEIRITDPSGTSITVYRSHGFSAAWPRAISIKRAAMPDVEVAIYQEGYDHPSHLFTGTEKKPGENHEQ